MNYQTTAKTIANIVRHLNRFGSDDKSLQHLAELYDGTYWNSGGNCMLTSIPLTRDFQIVVSDETACLYYNVDRVSEVDFAYLNTDETSFPYITIWDYIPSKERRQDKVELEHELRTAHGIGKTHITSIRLKDPDYIVLGINFLNRRKKHRRSSDNEPTHGPVEFV